MVTDFGKFTCKLLVDNDELMKDMAAKLEVTSNYLSAVEKGERRIPGNWVNLISENYNLTNQQLSDLYKTVFIVNGHWDVLRDLLGGSVVDSEGFSMQKFLLTI